jgi:hypothetical protein
MTAREGKAVASRTIELTRAAAASPSEITEPVQEHEQWFMDAEDYLKQGKRQNAARAYMRGFLLKGAADDLPFYFEEFRQGQMSSQMLYAILADHLESVVLKDFDRWANAPGAIRAIRAWAKELKALVRQPQPPRPVLEDLQRKLLALEARMPIQPHPGRKDRDPNRRPLPLGFHDEPLKPQHIEPRQGGALRIELLLSILLGLSALGLVGWWVGPQSRSRGTHP